MQTSSHTCSKGAAMIRMTVIPFIFFTGAASCQKVCSYQDVLDHLNLTTENNRYQLTRPVLDHRKPTTVLMDIFLYAILAVNEKTQTFIPLIWTAMIWQDGRISWDPTQFCGITHISLPTHLIWKPDIFIYEMVQKDESPNNPALIVHHNGTVKMEDTLRVVSTCYMDMYKFPFDTQQCNISLSSSSHTADEIRLIASSNSTRATQFSRETMKLQGDWEFLQLHISSFNFSFDQKNWEQLVYSFRIKRTPLLHIINFLLPVMFFLVLDLASFFISEHRGEKLGFKVTVLLAISVLLLILNEILPSMTYRSPLIASYCIVIFGLMLLSLLETILVMYLMEKDSDPGEKLGDEGETNSRENVEAEGKKRVGCFCIFKVYDVEKRHKLLPAVNKVISGNQSGELKVLLLILEQLKELQKTLSLHLRSEVPQGRLAKWAARINQAYFILYIITVLLWLPIFFIEWIG